MKARLIEIMWEFICHQNLYSLTYKKASRTTALDGIVVLLDGYDASYWLRSCNKVKFILNGKMKQIKARLI